MTPKPSLSGEIQFEEALCGHCNKAIAQSEISQWFTKVEMDQLEEKILNKRIELDPKMVRCECGSAISFEPSKPDYKSKDEQNKIISRQAAEHMAQCRVRCSNC